MVNLVRACTVVESLQTLPTRENLPRTLYRHYTDTLQYLTSSFAATLSAA